MYIYIYTLYTYMYIIYNLLAFNSPFFRTYFISFWKFFLTLYFIKLATMSPSGRHPPHRSNTDMLYLGDQYCQQTCWIFLDEPQSFFYACLSYRLSVQFYTCFYLIMCLLCLLYHLIYYHSSLNFLYEIVYCLLEHSS